VLERLGSVTPGKKAASTRVLVIGAVAFVIVLAGWLIYSSTRPGWYTFFPTDLGVYRDGGLIVRHVTPPYNGKYAYPLYDWQAGDKDSLQFTYTPFAAVFFAAVSIIPWSVLPRLSEVANLVFLLIAAWFTMDALGYRDRRVKIGGMLAGSAAGLLIEPVFRTIFLGQINLLLMALIIWDLRQPDDRWWKGIGTGLAAGIKLVPIVFVPYLLLTRRFKAAVMTVAGFVFTIALGFLVIPRDSTDWWLDGLFLKDKRTGFAGWTGNQSLHGLVVRLAGSLHAATTSTATAQGIVAVVGLACAAQLDRAGHPMLGILTAALVGLLDSPISWDHHWVWIVPGMMAAAHYAVRAWRARSGAVSWTVIGWAATGVAMLLIFAPWPGKLWSHPETGAGAFNYGLVWAGNYTPVSTFVRSGDKPWFLEYHWTGLQILAGNAYVLAGIALLILLAFIAAGTRRQARPGVTPESSPAEAVRPA
jgi:alpha-1,2-mannosyltransferase